MSDSFFINYARYFILLSALIGFAYMPKLKKLHTQYLPIFLLVIFIAECVGAYLTKNGNNTASSNLYIYILLPLQILFYMWVIGKKILNKPTVTFVLMALFVTVFLIEIFIGKQTPSEIFTRSFSLGGILLSSLVVMYILNLTKSDEVLTFHLSINFWICIAVLLYYTLSFPFYTFYNTLLIKYKTVFYVYRNIVNHLSLSMYFLFTIGFIWSKRT